MIPLAMKKFTNSLGIIIINYFVFCVRDELRIEQAELAHQKIEAKIALASAIFASIF